MEIIENFQSKFVYSNSHSESLEPSIEYERLRRRVQQNIQEMWNYLSSELSKIKDKTENTEVLEEVEKALNLGAEHKRSLLYDMEQMRLVDGYEQWRHKEAKALSDLVQRRLHYLQNPEDCQHARKLICKLNKVN